MPSQFLSSGPPSLYTEHVARLYGVSLWLCPVPTSCAPQPTCWWGCVGKRKVLTCSKHSLAITKTLVCCQHWRLSTGHSPFTAVPILPWVTQGVQSIWECTPLAWTTSFQGPFSCMSPQVCLLSQWPLLFHVYTWREVTFSSDSLKVWWLTAFLEPGGVISGMMQVMAFSHKGHTGLPCHLDPAVFAQHSIHVAAGGSQLGAHHTGRSWMY